ncbi:hypothetical protein [Massilia sp. 9I]|uniref:hypothetical protein n=1 Tax=Massilia sp. 9I TaxID=2653152 RepID=UPI0012F21DD6|nr:hypothetical protein [Massilia sp. 9I]VXC58899.1 conserved hypothetical protein [Massilia sp. 9I]
MPIQTQLLATILARLGPDSSAADAASAAGIWHIVFTSLSPLIGPLSAGLLFERVLMLHTASFPWLADATTGASDASLLDAFVRTLHGRSATEIDAANRALLSSYTDELAGLIGASLASRLLQKAFFPNDQQGISENI